MASASTAISAHRALRFLITGGARGLGRGLSRRLLLAGHDVFLLDNNSTELHYTLSEHLPTVLGSVSSGSGGRFEGKVCDVSDPSSVRAAVHEAVQWHRGNALDVLINNAGRTNPYWPGGKSMDEVDPEEWNKFIGTNLSGAFYVSQAAIPYLKRQGAGKDQDPGCVIHISSTRSKQSEPNQEGYSASKAGILGLTHSMASSLSPHRIRVNAIIPGWLPASHESRSGDTANGGKGTSWDAELTKADQEQHWAGRAGTIEDLEKTVMFLATTGFVTGEEIVLDGGMTKKMIYEE